MTKNETAEPKTVAQDTADAAREPGEGMTRTEARELLMQLLFQMEIQKDYGMPVMEQYVANHFQNSKQRQYAQKLCSAVVAHLDEIDTVINRHSKGWSTKRMPKVDLAIIRLALGEILYMEQVPDPVAINEAVDMAKKYSVEESRRYINGILGQVVKAKK